MIIAKTDRLIIEHVQLSDAPFIKELLNTEGFLTFIGDKGVRNLKDAENYIGTGPLKSYKAHGFGLFLVRKKSGNDKIGLCGILKRDVLRHPDLGFAFLPEFYGQGFALESAEAVLTFAKHSCRIKTILAFTALNNTASQKLLKNLGMKYLGSKEIEGYDDKSDVFEIKL
jgi:RimJ/RimL family protein N-acetyltransferase